MLGEVGGKERLDAIQNHRAYLKQQLQLLEGDPALTSELEATEDLLAKTYAINNNPHSHWVAVTKSRVVDVGAVGKVVYASSERGHCRVEFGTGERVSCGFGNVEVLDWEPLPAFIPWVGERVKNTITNTELIAIEWTAGRVRVHPPGLDHDRFWLDRHHVVRLQRAQL